MPEAPAEIKKVAAISVELSCAILNALQRAAARGVPHGSESPSFVRVKWPAHKPGAPPPAVRVSRREVGWLVVGPPV